MQVKVNQPTATTHKIFVVLVPEWGVPTSEPSQ
jgi:hypothetical protein